MNIFRILPLATQPTLKFRDTFLQLVADSECFNPGEYSTPLRQRINVPAPSTTPRTSARSVRSAYIPPRRMERNIQHQTRDLLNSDEDDDDNDGISLYL